MTDGARSFEKPLEPVVRVATVAIEVLRSIDGEDGASERPSEQEQTPARESDR